MLSSLIFAALAVAWLVVLVPMFARRRQEVSKTADSALAARVVRRGGTERAPGVARRRLVAVRGDEDTANVRSDDAEEADGMPDTDLEDPVDEYEGVARDDADARSGADDAHGVRVHSDDARAGRRYRPGRGGFDPEAAALAARATYARRQRTVLILLASAVVTGLLASVAWGQLWWLHGMVDLSLVGYLAYLRRQVRIEEDVRNRRLARMSGGRADEDDFVEGPERDEDVADREDTYWGDTDWDEEREREERRSAGRRGSVARLQHAEPVELDDDDPLFDELDERTWEPYRRAVGE